MAAFIDRIYFCDICKVEAKAGYVVSVYNDFFLKSKF